MCSFKKRGSILNAGERVYLFLEKWGKGGTPEVLFILSFRYPCGSWDCGASRRREPYRY